MGAGNGGNVVLQVITEFCAEFRNIIDGGPNDLNVNELSGGARISFVYHELFNNGIKSIDPFDLVKDNDIRTILYNSSGSTPSLFVGTAAFEIIVKQQIKRLEEPSLKCCALVYEELTRILAQILAKIVGPTHRSDDATVLCFASEAESLLPPHRKSSSGTLPSGTSSTRPSSSSFATQWCRRPSSSRTWSTCKLATSTPLTRTLSTATGWVRRAVTCGFFSNRG